MNKPTYLKSRKEKSLYARTKIITSELYTPSKQIPTRYVPSIPSLRVPSMLKETLLIKTPPPSDFGYPPPFKEVYRKTPPPPPPIKIPPDYPLVPKRKKGKRVFLFPTTERKLSRRERGYDIFKILKGKPQVVARGLYRESALDVGAREVMRNLRATFFLRKSDLTPREVTTGKEFSRYRDLFREPVRKSKYRKYGEAYIQKQSKVGMLGGRLAFPGEVKEIQVSRRRKMERLLR